MGAPNKENLRLLCEELETTKVPQVSGRLGTKEGGRCCLGVACDIFKRVTGQGGWGEGRAHAGSEAWMFTAGSKSRHDVPPWDVVEFYGMDDSRFVLGDGAYATVLNDGGVPFVEIAARIRDHYGIPKDGPSVGP